MRNLGEIIFDPRPGETEEAHAKRVEDTKKVFREALDNPKGHKLLNVLIEARHPMAPRTAEGRTASDVSFADGEASVIGLLFLNGTSKNSI